ncbi:hypothetical protein HNR19_000287 [Nocardioides thalensis]|uniref:Uncharacterized protein n=1 Tax=Nocardioides thalensis TaxID=1914755 RepID=A0A853BWG0_9ACTN|nr:hypothetical protein [Nocardioides thalensis]
MGLRSTPTPKLQVTCLDGEACILFLEPWGTEVEVRQGNGLTIESTAFLTGDVEIGFVPEGIMAVFTADVPISITDEHGRRYGV